MKTMFLSFIISLLLAGSAHAQQAKGQLNIQLNKNILQTGDSLIINVDYKNGAGQMLNQSLATLDLIIGNEDGLRTRLRWPMIDGQSSGALYLPDSLPRGKYTLLAGLQQRFFEVKGTILDNRKNISLQAMLFTKSGDWAEQEVPVDPDGTFAIRNWLFEENALLAFSSVKNSNQPLNISISTQLDSSSSPIAVGGRTFFIGDAPPAARSILDEAVKISETTFADRGTVLPAVVVRTITKTPEQQFNEEYVSGLFRSGDERIISLLDNPAANGFQNIFSFLQGRVAGLQISPAGFSGGSARWRGNPVSFFLDEVRVPAQQIASIPMSDIAIVKAYPPPFIGALGGGGALAIYTRRGGEPNLPLNSRVFKVRGYTPSATSLDMNKLSL